MTMHKFIMKYPQIMDICDFAYYACGKSKIAYEFAGVMLLTNNIMLIGFHVFTGAKIINTLSDHSQCTVVFSVIVTLMGIVLSLPRTLHHVSFLSMFSGTRSLNSFIMSSADVSSSCLHGSRHSPLHGLRRHRTSTILRL